MDSILGTVKKTIGLSDEQTAFDADLIVYINTAIGILNQLGIGKEGPFVVKSGTDTWFDFIADIRDFEGIKSYVCLKVRLMFDPPTSSSLIDSINSILKELEWRINVQSEKNNI